jgi:excisionase family DNA binding protein
MPEPLLSAADVAAWLKLNVETIYDLIAHHQFPAIKIGGQWRFQEAKVLKWLERHNASQS